MEKTLTPAFICHGCGQAWYAPPDVNCPRCGPGAPCDPPPEIWEPSLVSGTHIRISAHLRDENRIQQLSRDYDVRAVLDVANDPGQVIVYRSQPNTLRKHFLHVTIPGLVDRKHGELDRHALQSAVSTLYGLDGYVQAQHGSVLVHCAAGLRRAPHVVYAYLRSQGLPPDHVWGMITAYRPFVQQVPTYIEQIEDMVEAGEL